MQTDAMRQVGGPEITTDLCIIGAGPAGITIARELDGTDIRICLLESGALDIDWRAQEREYRGESDGYPLKQLHRSRMRVFGGSLRHPGVGDDGWAARPLDPIDFEPRPDVPNSGWPFDRVHLDPFYARAQARTNLGAYNYDVAHWCDSHQGPMQLDGTGVETTMFQFGQPAFHDSIETLSHSHNIKVELSSRVVGLTVSEHDRRISDVMVRRPDGSRLVVKAHIVVLATGGIENARLLLLADDMRGVGNEYDLVGRYFSERLSSYAGHIVTKSPEVIGEVGLYRLHQVGSTMVRGALRVEDKVQRDRGLRNCAFFVEPGPAGVTERGVRSLASLRKAAERRPSIGGATVRRHVTNIVRGMGGIASYATRRGATHSALTLRAQGEQAPSRESRIVLGSGRDDIGLPVARATWVIGEDDRESVRCSLELVDAALRTSGVGHVQAALDPPPLVEGNNHHMGTTRMHVDPRQGVVDANCRVHSVPNLYVAGSSVFPTYGASNPTLTVTALAVRLADHLRRELRARQKD